ncbi:MAG: lytic transglycosylase domain-containing protein [Candidatus Eremiobacteraeota bacterium]|nr:lytic transglycosylase domain-containing protein [Candidatus Eremiobacteraeota bacterium]
MRKSVALIGAALFVFSAFSCVPARAADGSATTGISVYAKVLRKINPRLQQSQSRDLAQHVLMNAARWNVDANLLIALVTVESRWRPSARSRVGAFGLGQLMPGTARTLGVNSHNADQNLSGCAHYLSGLITKYGNHTNQYQLAFAAYNAGPKAVDRYHGIPPFNETQHYVVRVMRMWQHFTKIVRIPAIDSQITTAAPSSDWYSKFEPATPNR